MIINQIDKTFLVQVNDEEIYVYPVESLSYCASIHSPLEFRGSANGRYKTYTRSKNILPITEEEIAILFKEDNNIIEQAE